MMMEQLPFLVLSLIFFLICGGVVFLWGRYLLIKGIWLLWTGLLAVLISLGFDTGWILQEVFQKKIWMKGWIWPRGDFYPISVAILQDPLSYLITLLVVFLIALLFMSQKVISQTSRCERYFSALTMSAVGVIFSWMACTPWLALAGISICLLAGLSLFGSCWTNAVEAKLAVRLALERAFGLVLAFLGVCLLSSVGGVFFTDELVALNGVSLNLGNSLGQLGWLGSLLFALGLLIQMQPFPFFGGLILNSELSVLFRVIVTQLFPSLAAFGVLLRAYPYWVHLNLFPTLGWISLCCMVLAIFCGFFQQNWWQVLGLWISAGFSLSCVILSGAGVIPAFSFVLGLFFCSLCFLMIATAERVQIIALHSDEKKYLIKKIWLNIPLYFSVLYATGMLGSMTAIGILAWIVQNITIPLGWVCLFFFMIFLFSLLSWKLSWRIQASLKSAMHTSWLIVFSCYLCCFCSLSLFWTGSLTGGLPFESKENWILSIFNFLFQLNWNDFFHSEQLFSILTFYCGTLLISCISGYWFSGRKGDSWDLLKKKLPKITTFLSYGYRLDDFGTFICKVLQRLGQGIQHLFDEKIWYDWIFEDFLNSVATVGRMANSLSQFILFVVEECCIKVVELPARTLQWIQNGDVRWYLVFALTSSFILFSYFIKL